MDPQDIVTLSSVLIVALTQIAAIFAPPKVITGIGVLNQIFKVIVGNYGKAKNKDE